MAQYSPLSGESFYDIAAKLYDNDTALGILDILTLNQNIDPNADLFGTTIIYRSGLTRKKVVVEPITTTKQAVYVTSKNQSVYDLALQLYGDVAKIGNILTEISDIDVEVPFGTSFLVPEQQDPQALFFKNKIIATNP